MFSGTVSILSGSSGAGGTVSLLPGGGGTSGTVSILPSYSYIAPTTQSYNGGGTYYNYQAPASGYSLPGAGMQAGPFGERGPYTPLDFPLMRELMSGERLENLNPGSGRASGSVLPYLALGIILALLMK